ncbi:Transcriptional regulator, ArsR family [Thiomonas sp. X19]|uniref:HVO_A0114 family putative DNA-binding protein n=1 Tax=Thiomonas sp. X19 TaxID=1050370 RepID=UPI000B646746|nr:HTH domain-containing protein [Thiomonas sp. X19]SCC95261.1 Transcriptional regulator, ArsR family [Thiomonas sp. X19]
MIRVVMRAGTVEEFFNRAKDAARRADTGGPFEGTVTLSFEDPQRLFDVLTQNRQTLVRAVMRQPDTIPELAKRLKRDRTAVTRDVLLLEKLGVVKSERVSNPGHGIHKLVRPSASRIDLVATIE